MPVNMAELRDLVANSNAEGFAGVRADIAQMSAQDRQDILGALNDQDQQDPRWAAIIGDIWGPVAAQAAAAEPQLQALDAQLHDMDFEGPIHFGQAEALANQAGEIMADAGAGEPGGADPVEPDPGAPEEPADPAEPAEPDPGEPDAPMGPPGGAPINPEGPAEGD